jgi:hypothetical protein
MRVLLRRTTNGFYYQGAGKWINNPEKGYDFGSIYRAVEFAGISDPERYELALAFESSNLISPVSLRTVQATLPPVAAGAFEHLPKVAALSSPQLSSQAKRSTAR